MLYMGEDLGTQRGPLLSPSLFRKHIRPRLQAIVDLGAAYGIPVMFHSCGSSSWAFEDFIEMGIGVVDTLQPEAKDMAPALLKCPLRRPPVFPRQHLHRRAGRVWHARRYGRQRAGSPGRS
jgi:hypothetical protein